MEYKKTYGKERPHILKTRDITESKEYGIQDMLYTVKLTKEQMADPAGTIRYWFTDHYSSGHAYDCCGCWRYTTYTHTLRHTKRREFTFLRCGRANI